MAAAWAPAAAGFALMLANAALNRWIAARMLAVRRRNAREKVSPQYRQLEFQSSYLLSSLGVLAAATALALFAEGARNRERAVMLEAHWTLGPLVVLADQRAKRAKATRVDAEYLASITRPVTFGSLAALALHALGLLAAPTAFLFGMFVTWVGEWATRARRADACARSFLALAATAFVY
jgi:hypothetical protein